METALVWAFSAKKLQNYGGQSFYKNKLYKNNEAEIGQKIRAN